MEGEGEGEGEIDHSGVKNLSLDFETGQRILAKVHILCQVGMSWACSWRADRGYHPLPA